MINDKVIRKMEEIRIFEDWKRRKKNSDTKFAKELYFLKKPLFHFIFDWYRDEGGIIFPHYCKIDKTYKIGYIFKVDIGGRCIGI